MIRRRRTEDCRKAAEELEVTGLAQEFFYPWISGVTCANFSADSEAAMKPKVKWGVIGVAGIAVKKVFGKHSTE
jgi:hypothetical protein